jgi:hypothetical protein
VSVEREEQVAGIDFCEICGSDDPKKYYAWSTASGGRWISWFKCAGKFHLKEKS